MAETTGISWANATFNPWVGCAKVSPGCANCYAETLVTGRMGRSGTWGEDGRRERTSAANWRKPLAWDRLAAQGLLPDGVTPARGVRPRVFCASLADAFEPRPELEPWRRDLFDLIESTPELDWLLLTKRPEVASEELRARYWPFGGLPPLAHVPESHGCPPHGPDPYLPNLWLGVSIENARHTWRADVLREIPATVRFLSCEPLLGSLYPDAGSVEVGQRPTGRPPDSGPARRPSGASRGVAPATLQAPGQDSLEGSAGCRSRAPLDLTGIDWVIVGGESGGPGARAMHPQWAREIRDACAGDHWCNCHIPELEGAGQHSPGCRVFRRPALHMKQWGAWAPGPGSRAVQIGYDGRVFREPMVLDARPDLLVEPGWVMHYAGPQPTSGGKLLDGVEWCEVPESRSPVPA